MLKNIFLWFEDIRWNIKCRYAFWLHGPYGLAKVVERMPFRFIIKYLRKYGATIGKNCRFERGLNLHRPLGKRPFENLVLGNNIYLGHNTLIDLSRKVTLKDNVIIASRCQIWTHTSHFEGNTIETYKYSEYFGEVIINEGAMIYSNVVIIQGIQIGKFSKIGASSLVNKPTENQGFYAGIPARLIKRGGF